MRKTFNKDKFIYFVKKEQEPQVVEPPVVEVQETKPVETFKKVQTQRILHQIQSILKTQPVPGQASKPSASTKEEDCHLMVLDYSGFKPSTLTIQPNTTVRISVKLPTRRNPIRLTGLPVDVPDLFRGDQFEHKFTSSGTFYIHATSFENYSCSIHVGNGQADTKPVPVTKRIENDEPALTIQEKPSPKAENQTNTRKISTKNEENIMDKKDSSQPILSEISSITHNIQERKFTHKAYERVVYEPKVQDIKKVTKKAKRQQKRLEAASDKACYRLEGRTSKPVEIVPEKDALEKSISSQQMDFNTFLKTRMCEVVKLGNLPKMSDISFTTKMKHDHDSAKNFFKTRT